MKIWILIYFSISFSSLSYANEFPTYIVSKSGVTILSSGSWDASKEHTALKKLLNFILDKCEKNRHGLNIMILLGRGGIKWDKWDSSKVQILVSYDTILKNDTAYFEPLHLSRMQELYNLPLKQNWILEDRYDYNETDLSYSKNDMGLIITYNNSYDPDVEYYDRIIGITQYAVTNVAKIKKEQTYISIPMYYSHQNLSILSYNPEILKAFKTESYGFDPYAKDYSLSDIFIGLIFLFSFASIIYIIGIKRHC